MIYAECFKGEEDIAPLIEKIMKDWEIPGFAIAIVKDNKPLYTGAFGFKDVKNKKKISPDTQFSIASCSKTFTTAAMGILVDEKKLDWDKPVKEYMPDFQLKDASASNKITPRDLVCHRSGLPRYDWVWYTSKSSRKEIVERLRYLDLSKDFRSAYQYNNLMFIVAGYLIEVISGMTWEKFVEKKLLTQLNMNNTNFSINDMTKGKDFAKPYMKVDGKIREINHLYLDPSGPAGSMNSSPNDIAKWLLFQLAGGKTDKKSQLISTKTLNELRTPQILIPDDSPHPEIPMMAYGLGWNLKIFRGRKLFGHGGSIDGFSTNISFMPDKNLGIAVFANLESTAGHLAAAYSVYDIILKNAPVDWNSFFLDLHKKEIDKEEQEKKDEVKNRKTGAPPSHPLKDFAGKYKNPAYGTIEIKFFKNKLRLILNELEYEVIHYHYDHFSFRDKIQGFTKKFSFNTNRNGKVDKILAPFEPSAQEIIFERIEKK